MSGAMNSNECPAGSVRIETEAACRTAAAAAGKPEGLPPFVRTISTYPRGCYTMNSAANFNADPVGGTGCFLCQLLCATVTTTGAPDRCARTRINICIDT